MRNLLKRTVTFFVKVVPEAIKETAVQTQEAQLLTVASSLAYTTILSIIPALAVSFAIFKAFGGIETLYETVQPMILSYFAEGTDEEVIDTLRKFIDNIHTGTVGAGGLVGLIITTMSLLLSVEKSVNLVWQTPIKRNLFQRATAYWMFITLGPLAFAVVIGFATSNQIPLWRFLPSGTGFFITIILFFAAVYKWVPDTHVKWRTSLISALFTASLLNLARVGYSIYVQKVVKYNTVYGSLGAVPIILLWIYITWIIILEGAALGAALQKRSLRQNHF